MNRREIITLLLGGDKQIRTVILGIVVMLVPLALGHFGVIPYWWAVGGACVAFPAGLAIAALPMLGRPPRGSQPQ
jgi:hypothetical protein